MTSVRIHPVYEDNKTYPILVKMGGGYKIVEMTGAQANKDNGISKMNANLAEYYLIGTYPGSNQQHLLNDGGKAIAALEENKHLLLYIGKQLLASNTITSYQLLRRASEEYNNL